MASAPRGLPSPAIGWFGAHLAMPRTPEQYATYLSKRRDALAQFQPSSPPDGQPYEASAADSGRKLIVTAFFNANGEPADGRWTQIVRLCRLGTTRGRSRWLGTWAERQAQTLDSRGQSVRGTALNAEKRRNKQCLRQRVETWKQTVTLEMAGNVEHALNSPTANVGKTQLQARRDSLGFKVVKRTALTNAPKTSRLNVTMSVSPKQQATNSDLSYLPPSFPSHLTTSTPQHLDRRKPPIGPGHSSPSSLVSPDKVQLYDGTLVLTENPRVGRLSSPLKSHLAQSTLTRTPTRTPAFVDLKAPRSALPRSDSDYDFSSLNIPFNANDEGDFNPPFTSTQKDMDNNVQNPSKIFGVRQWKGYSSQFDVDRRVGEVAKLLEKDVAWYQKS